MQTTNKRTVTFIILSIASAVLMSMGFLLPHCGGFSLIGLVPLLVMDEIATREGRRFFGWHYLTFLLWNVMTTFWVCNATVGGGIFACTANALQMSVIWAIYRHFKPRLQGPLAYIFLACMWIAWERAYFDAEVSWPWLVLGNSFAGSTTCVQWYEYTGLLGGSLWVWASNLSIFALLKACQNGSLSCCGAWKKCFTVLSPAVVVVVPLILSWIIYAKCEPLTGEEIPTAVLQPNFDPYAKFESLTQKQQNEVLTAQMESVLDRSVASAPLLFVAPETFTSDVVLNNPSQSPTIQTFKATLAGHPNTNLLFGASTYEFFYETQAPSLTARPYRGMSAWYEDHNSAIMTDETPRIEIYHKSRLVVGVEKVPWPRYMVKLENALGGYLMGHCIGQERVSLLNFRQNEPQIRDIPVGCAVCYESIYPEHFASYVRAGARAMTVITNDSWWGNTPGYRQHLNYSRLRAIETRREIARSANTGISAFINSRGDIVSSTEWWERTSLEGTLHTGSQITAFVANGDVTGRSATLAFILLMAYLIVRIIIDGHRPRNGASPRR